MITRRDMLKAAAIAAVAPTALIAAPTVTRPGHLTNGLIGGGFKQDRSGFDKMRTEHRNAYIGILAASLWYEDPALAANDNPILPYLSERLKGVDYTRMTEAIADFEDAMPCVWRVGGQPIVAELMDKNDFTPEVIEGRIAVLVGLGSASPQELRKSVQSAVKELAKMAYRVQFLVTTKNEHNDVKLKADLSMRPLMCHTEFLGISLGIGTTVDGAV